MNLYLGTLYSEYFWRNNDFAELPSVNNSEYENIVWVLDEVQSFFVSDSNDLLITKLPFNQSLKQYLNKIGIEFINNTQPLISNWTTDSKKSVCKLLINNFSLNDLTGRADNNIELVPYSVMPHTQLLCEKFAIKTHFPDLETIKKVNSKLFSTQITKELLPENRSEIACSITELITKGKQMLEFSPILIKDPFGVSGRGSSLVNNPSGLIRIEKHLENKEKEGKKICFVLEPLYNKRIDFSTLFEITENGHCRILATQQILNSSFSYLGTKKLEKPEMHILEQCNYHETISKVGQLLFNEGYFGPVCVDSLITTNNEVIPVIEINARKSMGYINHYLNQRFQQESNKSLTLGLSVTIPKEFNYDLFLEELEARQILYRYGTKTGIIPLSANTLTINRDLYHKSGNLGRLYVYWHIEKGSENECKELLIRLKLIFKTLKIEWHNRQKIEDILHQYVFN